jgi:2-polyprenyl-6-methoxyphenol hydroxylase-like FAD-dependent oxidoreductase
MLIIRSRCDRAAQITWISATMYFDALGQVRAPRWSRGRVALLGDAALCTPVPGLSPAHPCVPV